ncbi:hypothetical protein HMPREF1982_03975, partial [Clostridiales bacterium oral taxon 876 str. F0540]
FLLSIETLGSLGCSFPFARLPVEVHLGLQFGAPLTRSFPFARLPVEVHLGLQPPKIILKRKTSSLNLMSFILWLSNPISRVLY